MFVIVHTSGCPVDFIKVFDRVRVANELGAENGQVAIFATSMSVVQSTVIGLLVF